jgi:DNA-3-methyladenine glycosylase II
MLHSTSIQPPLGELLRAEEYLSSNDKTLAPLIASIPERWPNTADRNPIWGLACVVISQQISTKAAFTIRTRIATRFPELVNDWTSRVITEDSLRACGLSPRKAACCAYIFSNASLINRKLQSGADWQKDLVSVRGIGKWTLTIFRMLVLREPDLFPEGDLGLMRAINRYYLPPVDLKAITDAWRPYRSVACWYLWRSLGNPPLG